MTEFTPEWIEEQKKLMENYTTEGVFENPHVDYSFELDILQEHYPKALDEIQRLQAIIELADIDYESEHEAKENLQMATDTVIACLQSHVQELDKSLHDQIKEDANRIDNRDKRIAELEAAQRWIPVCERLPECVRVLVYMSNFYMVVATYFKNSDTWKNDCGQYVSNITHWRPLPKPPNGGE